MDTDLYECLKTTARQEGRPIGAVLEEAARAFIENRKENVVQKSVLEALDTIRFIKSWQNESSLPPAHRATYYGGKRSAMLCSIA